MSRNRGALLVALIATLFLSPVANAGWLHISNSTLQAEAELQKHPARLKQVVYVTRDAAKPRMCVSYVNNFKQSSKGRVLTQATILRATGSEETVRFVGGLRKGFYQNCKRQKRALLEGDMVLFEHQFKGMPRLRSSDSSVDFIDVNSVVSTAGEPVLAQDAPLGLVPPDGTAPLGIQPSPKPGWFHSAKSVFQADGDNQKHPGRVKQTLFVPEDVRNASLCATYSNISEDKNDGRVVVTAKVVQPDGEFDTRKIVGGVRDNEFLACKTFEGKIFGGAMVEFSYELNNMPRLDVTSDVTGFADINSVVSSTGEPVFREPPPPPAPKPEPVPVVPTAPTAPTTPTAPTGPPSPPPASGGLSGADQACISKLLYAPGAGARQIVRPRGNHGGKFEVFGPRSVFANGVVVVSTLGFGPTYAAACADYERKRGPIGPSGPPLSSADIANWVWYSNMNSSAGPTAVRRDPRGGYHADYYRPNLGAIIVNVSSPRAAIDALRRAGL